MNKKNSDFEKVSHLLPLRVTGDLTVDEARTVDETVRYDEQTRTELESFTRTLSILQEAASAPLPSESAVVRGESSLWDRLEPQLGPAGKKRPRGMEWISTRYLAAACFALVALTVFSEGKRIIPGSGPALAVNSASVPTGSAQMVSNSPQAVAATRPNHVVLNVGESIVITELGVIVTRIERLMQRSLGLPDLNGVVVTGIVPNSAADRAGLKLGDCIVGIDKSAVYAPRHAVELFRNNTSDHEAVLDVIRTGQKLSLSVKTPAPTDDETGLRLLLPPAEFQPATSNSMEGSPEQFFSVAG